MIFLTVPRPYLLARRPGGGEDGSEDPTQQVEQSARGRGATLHPVPDCTAFPQANVIVGDSTSSIVLGISVPRRLAARDRWTEPRRGHLDFMKHAGLYCNAVH